MFLIKLELQYMSSYTINDLKHFLLFSQLTGKLNSLSKK